MTRYDKALEKIDAYAAQNTSAINYDNIDQTLPLEERALTITDAKKELLAELKEMRKETALKEINERKEAMRANTQTLSMYDKAGRYIDGLAHPGHHAYLFGDSGSFKTTFVTALCMQALEENESLECHYWGFDVSPPYVQAIVGIDHERFSLFSNQTVVDMKSFYSEYLNNELRLDNTIIVLDTFKFLSNDINGKNSNKEAMHYIKSIIRLGAAWVSIGHTNKDGKSQSGTAEIEQDSDALLRIDKVVDGNKAIANIKNGGRVRWGETNITIQTVISEDDKERPHLFWGNAIRQAQIIGNVDIERMKSVNELAPDMERIAKIIQDYKAANKEAINKTELIKLIKDNEHIELSAREVSPTLKAGLNRYWKASMDKQNHNRQLYYPM
jgi:hypothetical protein